MTHDGEQATFVSPLAIDVYDEASGKLSSVPLSEPRRTPGVALVGGKVVVAGGTRSDSSASRQIDIFDVASQSHTGLPVGSASQAGGRQIVVASGRILDG